MIWFGMGCPSCRSGTFRRLRRLPWMHWVPGVCYYQCNECAKTFLCFFKLVSYR